MPCALIPCAALISRHSLYPLPNSPGSLLMYLQAILRILFGSHAILLELKLAVFR